MRALTLVRFLAILPACTSGVIALDRSYVDSERPTDDEPGLPTDDEPEPYPFPERLIPHDGYWIGWIDHTVNGLWVPIMLIQDTHVDEVTGRVTVYSQAIAPTIPVSPPQMEPGECGRGNLGYVCAHPNAVYLNGSGDELETSDRTGSWWIKHTWRVDAEEEGDRLCPLFPPQEDYANCLDAVSTLLDDEATLRVGAVDGRGGPFEERWPIAGGLDGYAIESFVLEESGDEPVSDGLVVYECFPDQVSPLDGRPRPCREGD